MPHRPPGTKALLSLGLTDLEARIYIYLLSQSPATGYEIAKAVGKPRANTYEAIRSLEFKGAIVVDEDKKRMCSPVPLRQLMRQLKSRFDKSFAEAMELLEPLQSLRTDERVYQIRSLDQVIERARSILNSASDIALVDAYPGILSHLARDIERSAARGVDCHVKIYSATQLPGAKLVLDANARELMEAYPGDWLGVVADGRESLVAYITNNCTHVYQAVWTASPFLSLVIHSGIWADIALERIAKVVRGGGKIGVVRRIIQENARSNREFLVGYQALIQKEPTTAIE